MKKKWIMPQGWHGETDKNAEELILRLLADRGIREPGKIAEFLNEKPQETYDPFLLKNMDLAVEMLLRAIKENRRICIYGDYDADGVTSCSLLLEVLAPLTPYLSYYIPSRFEEGYGLNRTAVETLAAEGVNLLVTVDCGSASYAEVERAKELGMEVMVTDHHSMQAGNGSDCLVVNPKQEDCPYPFKELSGCGVAFKLVQALKRTMDRQGDARISQKKLNGLLDLVAISTVGDMVPLISENRTLVKHGLGMIHRGGRPGLDVLIHAMGLMQEEVNGETIAYIIVPHLNAAGRMTTAKTGVELLTGQGDLQEEAAQLVACNKERKAVQEQTYQDCLQMAEKINETHHFLLIDGGNAHEGIAGIVAGKIKEHFWKPTILVTDTEEGTIKGTGRSIEGVNLFTLLDAQRELFDRFGGHSGACGFSMGKENLDRLRQQLEWDMNQKLEENPLLLEQKIEIHGVLSLQALTESLVKELGRMEPFGFGNEKPIFLVEELTVFGVKYMGSAQQHVKFVGQSVDGRRCDCIAFGCARELKPLLESGDALDVIGYPDLNRWNGKTKIQFMVRDGRRSQWKSK